jgi:hypothetical protein
MEGETVPETPEVDTNKISEPETKLEIPETPEPPAAPAVDDAEKADEEKPEGEEGEEREEGDGVDEEHLTEDAEALQEELAKIVVVTPPRSPRM